MPDHAIRRWTGVFPIAPTPFTDTGDLDLEGQRRVLDCMIDQGVDGICVLANYSEQFALSDAERDVLLDLCLSHAAGRVPMIVTCSHFSTRIAADRARKAGAAGANMIMLMPPYHGTLLRAEERRRYGKAVPDRSALAPTSPNDWFADKALTEAHGKRAPASPTMDRCSPILA